MNISEVFVGGLFFQGPVAIGYMLKRRRIGRMSAADYPPQLADTFARWRHLERRGIDVFVAGIIANFLGFAILFRDVDSTVGDRLDAMFWPGVLLCVALFPASIVMSVFARKAAKLKPALRSGWRELRGQSR